MGRTGREAADLRDRAAALFEELGLCLRREKCQREPVQRPEHVGLMVDTMREVFAVGRRGVVRGTPPPESPPAPPRR